MTLAQAMTLVPIKLRILHLSDIHFREAAGIDARLRMIQRETPRRARVMAGDAWRRNLSELLDDGPIDLVCITGDLADWGKAAEFELGSRFVEQLLDAMSLTRERLFVVPGNHDIDRSVAESAWSGIRGQIRMNPDDLSDWMAGGSAPAGVDAGWCDRVLEREAAFWAWVEHGLGRPELLPSRSPHGRLGYRVEIGTVLGLRVPVWLLGLDTAWLAGNDADAGKLRLTKAQLLQLGTTAHGLPLDGFRVAIGHHPLGELGDASEARRLLAEHVDVYLHGHQHQPTSVLFADPDRRLVELAAGCVFEGSRKGGHPNGLSVLTVALDELGRPQQGELRFRSWSPRGGCWHDDSSIYEIAKHGRLELSWPDAAGLRSLQPTAQPSFPRRTLDDAEHVLALTDDLHDRLRTALELNDHRATIALVIAPPGLVADVEQVRDRLGLAPSQVASWVIDFGPRAREQITALNRSRDTLLAEKRLIWLRGSTSDDLRFVRRAAPDLTASIDVFADLRAEPQAGSNNPRNRS